MEWLRKNKDLRINPAPTQNSNITGEILGVRFCKKTRKKGLSNSKVIIGFQRGFICVEMIFGSGN